MVLHLAGGADAGDFDGVFGGGEALFGGHAGCPAFDRGACDFDCGSAYSADQVMVVTVGAVSVSGLAVIAHDYVDSPVGD